MSTDAISTIREAEKLAETAERDAKERASEIISKAHSDAKELISSKISAAKTGAESKLTEISKVNESFLQKAEIESSEEVKALRSQAEGKKKEVAEKVTEILF
ncbi:MAG: hypothetical protein ACTTKP_05115 [Catonella sp.]|uniref:hypothetical protein n=1 Tax=Catonella sp. TaxID=2382125 RepID=UPI003F9F62B7